MIKINHCKKNAVYGMIFELLRIIYKKTLVFIMKTLIIILVLAVAGFLGFKYFSNNTETVKITGNIQVSQRGNFDINAPRVSGPMYVATVNGTVQNISAKPLKNVFIKYSIGGKSTSAMIFELNPGQQTTFTTSSVRTIGKNPSFNLDDVQYDETK